MERVGGSKGGGQQNSASGWLPLCWLWQWTGKGLLTGKTWPGQCSVLSQHLKGLEMVLYQFCCQSECGS